jgi:hypothetical protein
MFKIGHSFQKEVSDTVPYPVDVKIMYKLLEDSSPFLFPCTIEFRKNVKLKIIKYN